MGLLPNTSNCGCACVGNAGNVFPATAGKQSRHASRHVRDGRAVMHARIANSRFLLNSAAGENVPGIPGACATRNFTYLVRGPCCRYEALFVTRCHPDVFESYLLFLRYHHEQVSNESNTISTEKKVLLKVKTTLKCIPSLFDLYGVTTR